MAFFFNNEFDELYELKPSIRLIRQIRLIRCSYFGGFFLQQRIWRITRIKTAPTIRQIRQIRLIRCSYYGGFFLQQRI